MSRNKRPRKAYRPRPPRAASWVIARNQAGLLTTAELDSVLVPLRAAFDKLRQGQAKWADWALVGATLVMARNIEDQGVVRGLAAQIRAADDALDAIKTRASAHMPPGQDIVAHWRPTALYATEISALDDLIWVHEYQLKNLSYGETRAAYLRTEAQLRQSGLQVQQGV